ncbi:hypothetical protein NEMBOFW57_009165 [Staphylotrichum longicolle]|uniref:Uncharacterized protein n=1 Tax=Staphylotrichum longicolle TaxID=669026 RepID=A0AAD4HWG3_9PEZI|nr:hypothetical protein NEMBOFW57_009165 [Staphylotrichum longicolle]
MASIHEAMLRCPDIETLQYRRLPKDQRDKTNLDLWLDAMDFSRIHTLQLNHTRGRYALTAQVAQKLPARLTSLTSLAVHNAIAEQFILALPNNSLSHLSWWNSGRERGQRLSVEDLHMLAAHVTTAELTANRNGNGRGKR